MPKTETRNENENPFLTEKSEALWQRLDKQAKPVSKEELVKRFKSLKGKKDK